MELSPEIITPLNIKDVKAKMDENNSLQYTIAKLVEETTELNKELIIFFTKYNPNHFSEVRVSEEIADVLIRLDCLVRILSIENAVKFNLVNKYERLDLYSKFFKEF